MNRHSIDAVCKQLSILKDAIHRLEFTAYQGDSETVGWAGSGFVFSTQDTTRQATTSQFYPADTLVVTSHAHAVGWFIVKAAGILAAADCFDYFSKHDFYQEMACAVIEWNNSTEHNHATDPSALLILMTDKACGWLHDNQGRA